MNEYNAVASGPARPVAHDGCAFGIAPDDELGTAIGGEVHRLGEGDLVAHHPTEPHRIADPGPRPARRG